jgi:hypothetical protein
MTHVPVAPEPWIQILEILNKRSKESCHAIYDNKDLMVQMGKLVQKFENRFFRNDFPEKMVKQINYQKTP